MSRRRYLTAPEKQRLLEKQNWLCAICGDHFGTSRVEFDHSTPHAFRPERKPDQACCKQCHLLKTKVDVRGIAKAKRLHRTFVLGEKRPKRKISSRGFDRMWFRKLDGSTVRRMA